MTYIFAVSAVFCSERELLTTALRALALSLVGGFFASPSLAAKYIGLGPESQLVDIGFDTVNRTVVGIGYDKGTPTLFRVAQDTGVVTRETLVGTGTSTQVSAISADGRRIAGLSYDEYFSLSRGVTWLTDAPDMPIEIGSIDGVTLHSRPGAAWSGGVAGNLPSGRRQAFSWSATGGSVFNDTDYALVADASLDGSTIVGNLWPNEAAYWESGVGSRLPKNGRGDSYALSVSPDADHIAGFREVIEAPGNMVYEIHREPLVWSRDNATGDYQVAPLRFPDGSVAINGRIKGLTNSGYAVGQLTDQRSLTVFATDGFIWHADFDGVQIFEEWLAKRGVLVEPTAYPLAVSDDPAVGGLVFAVSGPEEDAIVFAPLIPEPTALLQASLLATLATAARHRGWAA